MRSNVKMDFEQWVELNYSKSFFTFISRMPIMWIAAIEEYENYLND